MPGLPVAAVHTLLAVRFIIYEGVIDLLQNGVRSVNVGVNPGSAPPDVPRVFRWQFPGNASAEVVAMWNPGGCQSSLYSAWCSFTSYLVSAQFFYLLPFTFANELSSDCALSHGKRSSHVQISFFFFIGGYGGYSVAERTTVPGLDAALAYYWRSDNDGKTAISPI